MAVSRPIIAVLIGVAALQPAAAQSRREFQIEPRANFLYDSNLARSSAELAEARGLEQSDVRFSPGLNIDLSMPFSRQRFFVNGGVGYDFHRSNRRLNRERLDFLGGADVSFSRCSGRVTGNFSRKQSDMADYLDASGAVKNREMSRGVVLEGRCGGSVGLVPTLALNYLASDNSHEFRARADVRSGGVRAGLAYVRPTFGELSLNSSFNNVRYPNRMVPADGGLVEDGYRLWSLGARFERRIGARLKGSASLNHTRVTPKAGGTRFSGLTATADLNANLGPAWRARLGWTRDVRPSTVSAGTYLPHRAVSLDTEYALGSRMSLAAGALVERRSSQGDLSFTGLRLQSETRRSVFGRVSLKRAERLAIDLEARRERREADVELFDYISNRLLLSARLGI